MFSFGIKQTKISRQTLVALAQLCALANGTKLSQVFDWVLQAVLFDYFHKYDGSRVIQFGACFDFDTFNISFDFPVPEDRKF